MQKKNVKTNKKSCIFHCFLTRWHHLAFFKYGFLILVGLKLDYIVVRTQPDSGQKSVCAENASLSKLSRFFHLFGRHFETKQRIGSNRVVLERYNQELLLIKISNLYLAWCKNNSSLKKVGYFWPFFVKMGQKALKRVKICFSSMQTDSNWLADYAFFIK